MPTTNKVGILSYYHFWWPQRKFARKCIVFPKILSWYCFTRLLVATNLNSEYNIYKLQKYNFPFLFQSQGWSGVLKTGSGQAGCLAGRMSFATGCIIVFIKRIITTAMMEWGSSWSSSIDQPNNHITSFSSNVSSSHQIHHDHNNDDGRRNNFSTLIIFFMISLTIRLIISLMILVWL